MSGTGPRSSHKVDTHLWDADKKRIKEFEKAFVEVGVFSEEMHKNADQSVTPMAMIAAVHEYGAEIRNGWGRGITIIIPERSFLRSWVEQKAEQIDALIKKLYKAVTGNKMTTENAMKLLGAFGSSGVRQQILDGDFVPLAPSTIRMRENGGDKPLVDTGQLVNAIHYRLGKGDKAAGE